MRLAITCLTLAACWRAAPPPAPPASEPVPVAEARAADPSPPHTRDEVSRVIEEADRAFERGDLVVAEPLYRHALSFRSGPTADYARYKLGWVYVNLGKHQEALEAFVPLARGDGDEPLRNAAATDAAMVYAHVGRPQHARTFFQRVDPARVDELLEHVAHALELDGKLVDAGLVRAQITP